MKFTSAFYEPANVRANTVGIPSMLISYILSHHTHIFPYTKFIYPLIYQSHIFSLIYSLIHHTHISYSYIILIYHTQISYSYILAHILSSDMISMTITIQLTILLSMRNNLLQLTLFYYCLCCHYFTDLTNQFNHAFSMLLGYIADWIA